MFPQRWGMKIRLMNIELLTKNFYHYTPLYSDSGKPVLFENDILKIQISLNKKAAEDQLASTELTVGVAGASTLLSTITVSSTVSLFLAIIILPSNLN